MLNGKSSIIEVVNGECDDLLSRFFKNVGFCVNINTIVIKKVESTCLSFVSFIKRLIINIMLDFLVTKKTVIIPICIT